MWNFSSSQLEKGDDDQVRDIAVEQLKDPEGFNEQIQAIYKSQDKNYEKLYFKDGQILERYGSPVKGESGVYYGYVCSLMI